MVSRFSLRFNEVIMKYRITTVGITLFEVMPTTKYPNGKVARLMNMFFILSIPSCNL